MVPSTSFRFRALDFCADSFIIQFFYRRLLISNPKEPKKRVRIIRSIKQETFCRIAIPDRLDIAGERLNGRKKLARLIREKE